MSGVWRIELFGGLRAVGFGRDVGRFSNQKAAALLGYLAYHRRPQSREVLIELFWPDDEINRGRHKLSMALTSLRQQLEPEGVGDGAVIHASRSTVALVEDAYTTDVAEFEAALRSSECAPAEERIRHLTRAVELYRGELLSGLYENWVFAPQERLLHRFLKALRELIALQLTAGANEAALENAYYGVSTDPLSEELHQEIMRLQLLLGRPSAAVRQFRELERILNEELDQFPSAVSQALLQKASEARVATSDLKEPGLLGPPAKRLHPAAFTRPAPAPPRRPESESTGQAIEAPFGPVSFGSPLYIPRTADADLSEALQRESSIILLQGARQVGKTSLLGRGLAEARSRGAHVVLTDFRGLSSTDFRSPDSLLRALAREIADQLEISVDLGDSMGPERSPAVGFRRFLRKEVLEAGYGPLVWGMDEVDRLFGCDYYDEIFGLFRSWHNQRVLDPDGPWAQLMQVLSYSTEAHLFITQPHQSPFNVGIRVDLPDFDREQVAELNRRYGSPLVEPEEVDRLYDLLGGHPYLIQQGLQFAVRHPAERRWCGLEARPGDKEGPFDDHLRRLLHLLNRAPDLGESFREVLRGNACPTLESFYRLRSSGLLVGTSDDARPRCRLYARVLAGLLPGAASTSTRAPGF